MRTPRLVVAACALMVLPAMAAEGDKPAKQERPKITAVERAQGWKFLFDGGSLSDWRGYGKNKVPANWSVAEGWLVNAGGTALVSEEEFKDFELQFDWKADEGGVAEVWLRASEDGPEADGPGLLVDLAGGGGMGGNGGITELWRTITPQPGLWHRTKILVYGNLVEHWVDGDRVLTYTIDSGDWRAGVAKSRFAAVKEYGLLSAGRLVLAGKGAAFRNIKIRKL